MNAVLNQAVAILAAALVAALAAFLVPKWRKRIFQADAAAQEANAEKIRADTILLLSQDTQTRLLRALELEGKHSNDHQRIRTLERRVSAFEDYVATLLAQMRAAGLIPPQPPNGNGSEKDK